MTDSELPLPNEPSLVIVGSGAMACMFAACLSAANKPFMMFVNWSEGLRALNQNGVILVDADGNETVHPVKATNNPADCHGVRYALILVKSWQTERAARQLSHCLAADGLALTLQNGLGNREALAQVLGSQRVALGVTTIGANLDGPGRVRPAGEGVISLSIHPRLGPLTEILRAAGFMIDNTSDPTALLWGKLVINAAINPLTALLGVPNGELLVRSTARALMAGVAREAAAVAIAQGIRLPYPDPVVATETIARRTASNRSSMLQDVLRGAPTEIDAITGAIVRAAQQTGVPVPINRTLWQLVKALGGRGTGLRKSGDRA
jgi:2-dehydropantoate 2-reductase